MGAVYGKKEDWNTTFQLDYFSVNVEGQYIHIYYYGPFLLQKLIARIWKEIQVIHILLIYGKFRKTQRS